MKVSARGVVLATLLFMSAVCSATDNKTYKHASQYQVATLDKSFRIITGNDVTLSKSQTDAKLDAGGQGMHLLYTDNGNYRVEAPVNKGYTIGLALAAAMANQVSSPTIHNKWFLDDVQPGIKVLFAAECAKPNKRHPNETVRCTFWFPDPDSSVHEYATVGDFTPYIVGDGSNTQKTADTLCGTRKLKPEVEAQLCGAAQVPQPETSPQIASQTGTNQTAKVQSVDVAQTGTFRAAPANAVSSAAVTENDTAEATKTTGQPPTTSAGQTQNVTDPHQVDKLVQSGQASRGVVLTVPPHAEVYIDGKKAGFSPLPFVLVRSGDEPHIIAVEKDGFDEVEKKITPDGETFDLELILRRTDSGQ